jgi:hypothetical protein
MPAFGGKGKRPNHDDHNDHHERHNVRTGSGTHIVLVLGWSPFGRSLTTDHCLLTTGLDTDRVR